MAFDFSKLNFFSRLNARSRMLSLVAVVGAIVFLVYISAQLLSGGTSTTGPSRVASAPQGLQSVPGGQLTAEYQRALMQVNQQSAQQARLSGGSAVPTQINLGSEVLSSGNCVICSDESANVKNILDDMVKQGKVTPEVSKSLQQLAEKNVSVEEYAENLNQLVKDGKLTPEQARQLLSEYKKQHTNALLDDSAKTVDNLIKSGALSLETANQVLDMQKKNLTPAEYTAQIQALQQQGKLTPTAAQQVIAQYTQQRAGEIINKSVASLHRMAKNGEIIPEVEKELVTLEKNMVPVDVYSATLQRYMTAGKLVPMAADKILAEFKAQKAEMGSASEAANLLQKSEAAAFGEINDLMKAGQMPSDVGAQLSDYIRKDISFEDYKVVVDQLVQQKKISPEIGKLKIADYQLVKGLRGLQKRLTDLQGNNVSAEAYAEELKKAVQAGIITPEQAAKLMQEYQTITAKPVAAPVVTGGGPATEDFTKLQQQLQQGTATVTPTPTVSADQFAVAQAQVQTETDLDRQSRIQALMGLMSGQAQQLVAAWQPPTMASKQGVPETKTTTPQTSASGSPVSALSNPLANATANAAPEVPPIIKAGTILFAVLDTEANSDYADSPILATIVDGKYKGAKLMGKLVTVKGVSGQMDRISMNFTLMNQDDWTKSKTVTAYGIDPDTARTVMASQVDYHYMQRFGAIMATSFLQGYGQAVSTSGATTGIGLNGTQTSSNVAYSPGNKVAIALGQIGQTMGEVTKNYVNIPPTVRVDSGVGLGILFMSDVT